MRPGTSQHLRVLRDAGLVTVRPEGGHRYYRADQERLQARYYRADQERLQDGDRERLRRLLKSRG